MLQTSTLATTPRELPPVSSCLKGNIIFIRFPASIVSVKPPSFSFLDSQNVLEDFHWLVFLFFFVFVCMCKRPLNSVGAIPAISNRCQTSFLIHWSRHSAMYIFAFVIIRFTKMSWSRWTSFYWQRHSTGYNVTRHSYLCHRWWNAFLHLCISSRLNHRWA